MQKIDEIIENNRILLSEIAEKVKSGKMNELSDDNKFYAKFLFNNGFMDLEGNITYEGRQALLH